MPQLKILKLSDVFITHGGMNSVSEAPGNKGGAEIIINYYRESILQSDLCSEGEQNEKNI